MAVDDQDGFVIAVRGRWEAPLRNDAGAACVEHGEGDPVAVRVDADHVVNEFCKHVSGTSL